jgi:hypothetical protein
MERKSRETKTQRGINNGRVRETSIMNKSSEKTKKVNRDTQTDREWEKRGRVEKGRDLYYKQKEWRERKCHCYFSFLLATASIPFEDTQLEHCQWYKHF